MKNAMNNSRNREIWLSGDQIEVAQIEEENLRVQVTRKVGVSKKTFTRLIEKIQWDQERAILCTSAAQIISGMQFVRSSCRFMHPA